MTTGEHHQAEPSEPTLEEKLDEALGAEAPREVPPEVGSDDAGAPVAHLVVVGGPETGRLIRLIAGETVLGRSEEVAGKLRDPSASQRHAKVLLHDNGYVLVDLGSTNGTFLNEERLEGPVLLTHGDNVRIGKTVLRFLAKRRGARPNETVPLEPPSPALDAPPRQDLVRYRDARLTSWGPRELGAFGDGPPGTGTDWVVYLRAGIDYAKRYGLFVGIMAAIGVSAGALHALAKPPLGSAFFEIALSRDAKVNPVEEEGPVPYFVAAERGFTSTGAIKETLRRLGVEPTEQTVLAIQNRVTFTALDKQERVWRGEYAGPDAEQAKLFLTRHLEVYLEREIDKALHVLKSQVTLLEDQVERSGKELHQTEEELATFKRAHPGVVGAEGVEQYAALAPLQQRRDDLAAQVRRLKLELGLNRKRLSSGDALLQGRVSSAASYTTSVQDIEKQITEAKAEGLGEQHPRVKKLRGQLRELEQLRQSAITAAPTDLERRSNEGYVAVRERVRDLEVALRVAESELGQVTERLESTEGRVSELPEAEAQLSKLTRNYASTKALHDRLYQKLRAGRIQLKMEQQAARARYDLLTPPTPEHPNMTMAMAQRSALGGLGMFFLAAICAGVRETIRYVRSVL
jgi:pSer/pThr/pTyr-binding forkhead associated (FHA) protein